MAFSKFPLPQLAHGLSTRLLVLTIFFVMLAEVAIYVPSIARFREQYLQERIRTAHLATLALEVMPDVHLSEAVAMKLLDQAGAYGIALAGPGMAKRALYRKMPPKADAIVNLDNVTPWDMIMESFQTLTERHNRVLRVLGYSEQEGGAMLEVIIDETPLRHAMYEYSVRILGLSIAIALLTAGLVFISLQWLMVRPIRNLTENMVMFRSDPENPDRMITPSARDDEIGMAERELAAMQRDLRMALTQRARLAAIGAAVAKISHDLRNILQTASVVSDRIASIIDPEVRRMTPRLIESIDRAINLCQHTLGYARENLPPPARARFDLRALVDDVAADQAVANGARFSLENAVAGGTEVSADRDQLFRALTNLVKNAAEAGAKHVRVAGSSADGTVKLTVTDDGPGVPPKAQENLFQPFVGSAKSGGAGLGLVIARDILRAHGGDIALVETSEKGTVFGLDLPVEPKPQTAPPEAAS